MKNKTKHKEILRWVAVSTIILVIILFPFFVYGEQLENWFKKFMEYAGNHPLLSFSTIVALLGSDILLPIPSSFVNTASGILFGIFYGTLASFIGLTISCIFGYILGRFSGLLLKKSLLKQSDIQHLERMYHRLGDWIIAITRPVPVLAESSVLFAGMAHMPFMRFMILTSISNLGISLLYAITGHLSDMSSSLPFAFIGAILIPLIILIVYHVLKPSS
jgi:uncharacterized membrane protein YdjX (TVP38/TMEM64 family)